MADRIDPARAGARRIVVVDDNLDAAELLAYSLKVLGHETWVAHDGAAALELVRTVRPDVALVDLGLRIMDGYELAEQIRLEPELADLRLIALTGYGGESDRRRTREAGFQEHLVKPVTIDRLDGLLRAGA
jgi:CheY-like chemotaxis protein